MSNELRPKTIFQQNEDRAKRHREFISNPALEVGLTFTLAEMATMNVTPDQLKGANLLIYTFLNLAEKPEPRKESTLTARLVPPEKLVPPTAEQEAKK